MEYKSKAVGIVPSIEWVSAMIISGENCLILCVFPAQRTRVGTVDAYRFKHQIDHRISVWLYMGFPQGPLILEVKGEHWKSALSACFLNPGEGKTKTSFSWNLLAGNHGEWGARCNPTTHESSDKAFQEPPAGSAWILGFKNKMQFHLFMVL